MNKVDELSRFYANDNQVLLIQKQLSDRLINRCVIETKKGDFMPVLLDKYSHDSWTRRDTLSGQFLDIY